MSVTITQGEARTLTCSLLLNGASAPVADATLITVALMSTGGSMAALVVASASDPGASWATGVIPVTFTADQTRALVPGEYIVVITVLAIVPSVWRDQSVIVQRGLPQ